jgi:hypothetical protein
MELKLVMVVLKLIDIGTIPQQDIPHLFIIERTDEVRERLLKTIWHDCTYSALQQSWSKQQPYALFLPQCDRIYAVADNGVMKAIAKSNIKHALYLVNAAKREECSITPINLSIESATGISIPSSDAWSTPFLPMEQCLFNPQIAIGSNRETVITANAVDASARIFLADPDITEKLKIDHCIEPCFLSAGGKKMVFFRKCPADWAVYYNQPETRMAAELLPLTECTLNDDYTVEDTLNLSKGWVTGGSFAFDVCSTKDNAIVLATVSGLLDKPLLQILRSPDAGTKWKAYPSIALEEVPYRIKIGATKSRILVACVFKKHDGFHVMAAEFDR